MKIEPSETADSLQRNARILKGEKPQLAMPHRAMFLACCVVILWGVAQAGPLLVPLCVAALLAFLIAPFVRLLARFHIPEWLAIGLSVLVLLLPFSFLGYLLFDQGQGLIQDFPQIASSIDQFQLQFKQDLSNSALGRWMKIDEYLGDGNFTDRLSSITSQGLQFAVSGLGAVLSAGSQIAIVLLFTVVMLSSRKHLRRNSERILPAPLLDEASSLIERFLSARFLIMAIIACADMAVLLAFNVSYAFLLGVFLGVMTIVPAIGFVIGLTPAILVSIATKHSLLSTLGLVSSLAVMSFVESNILTPRLAGKSININAFATFVGLFAGGLLWGIWGMLLSIPILGVIRVAMSAEPRLQVWSDFLAGEQQPKPSAYQGPPGNA